MRQRKMLFKKDEGNRIPKMATLNQLKLHMDRYYKDRVGYSKEDILNAIDNVDMKTLRAVSKRAAILSSGIYSRLL